MLTRRLVLSACIASGLLAAGSAFAQKKEEFQTAAPYAILMEAETGTVLFEKAADTLTPPASLAKLMTMAVVYHAIENREISIHDEYTVSEHAWRRGGAPSGSSAMFLPVKSQAAVADLIKGAVIQSGNDACIVLAEGIAGSERNFAELMNNRAKELGLTKSSFVNPTGFHDPDQKVTMREMALLARHIILDHPEHYKVYAEQDFTWNKIRQRNRNPLLAMNIGADGLKTGYLKESGYALVASAKQGDLRLILAISGLKSEKERADEARRLLDWGFRGFEGRPLFAEGQTIGEAKVYGGDKGKVPLIYPKGAVTLMVPRGAGEKIIARIVYTGPVRAPVTKGQPIGRLKIWRGDIVALELPLQAAEDIGPGNMSQRAFDAATEMVINLFRAGAERL
jgi:D-alanyl-D-alanine carboxypeptidase (penicillin-binding protein 5/6)